MAKRKLMTGVLVAIGVAALAGCGGSTAKPPASGGAQTPTSITPVTNAGGGGNGY